MSDDPFFNARDLPQVLAVFPLEGALLLPHASRPLNIFEPRYLNMIDDAMASERIIGMVQTAAPFNAPSGARERPLLAPVGCAGRITAFSETGDGRYLITLTGLARFRVGEELPASTPYRRVRADFSAVRGRPGARRPEAEDRPRRTAGAAQALPRPAGDAHRLGYGADRADRTPGQQPGHGPAVRRGRAAGPAGGGDRPRTA